MMFSHTTQRFRRPRNPSSARDFPEDGLLLLRADLEYNVANHFTLHRLQYSKGSSLFFSNREKRKHGTRVVGRFCSSYVVVFQFSTVSRYTFVSAANAVGLSKQKAASRFCRAIVSVASTWVQATYRSNLYDFPL